MKLNSLLLFGREEETNGETAFCLGALTGVGIGLVGLSNPAFSRVWMEVLLRDASISLDLCALRCREEKNEVFEAVIGVVGVFVLLCAGGVVLP